VSSNSNIVHLSLDKNNNKKIKTKNWKQTNNNNNNNKTSETKKERRKENNQKLDVRKEYFQNGYTQADKSTEHPAYQLYKW